MTATSISDRAEVRDNTTRQRFELDLEGGGVAFASYRRVPGRVIIIHTETPMALRGHGIASRLIAGALHLIRAEGSKVSARCGFVAQYLATHREWRDLDADQG
jgi:uncharacterized protein